MFNILKGHSSKQSKIPTIYLIIFQINFSFIPYQIVVYPYFISFDFEFNIYDSLNTLEWLWLDRISSYFNLFHRLFPYKYANIILPNFMIYQHFIIRLTYIKSI